MFKRKTALNKIGLSFRDQNLSQRVFCERAKYFFAYPFELETDVDFSAALPSEDCSSP